MRNKCYAAVTINEIPQSSKTGNSGPVKGPLREIQIQGQFIREIEEALTKRYVIPQKFIESTNKLPEKKKKK